MKLDNEIDRRLLIAAINQAQFKGEIVELVANLKQRIAAAPLDTPPPDPAKTPPA